MSTTLERAIYEQFPMLIRKALNNIFITEAIPEMKKRLLEEYETKLIVGLPSFRMARFLTKFSEELDKFEFIYEGGFRTPDMLNFNFDNELVFLKRVLEGLPHLPVDLFDVAEEYFNEFFESWLDKASEIATEELQSMLSGIKPANEVVANEQ